MKIFKILNSEISISKEMQEYNRLNLEYKRKAYESEQKFIQIYSQNNKSLDDVSNNALQQGYNVIYAVISDTVNEIVKMGFYNINEDLFISQYYMRYCDWEETFNEINEQYLEIVMTQEQLDEYRVARRQNRSRWQGGGFGVSGGIKGATKAGMMNMASGVAHATFKG